MKKVFFLILMVLGLNAYAQIVQLTQVEYNKVNVPGVSFSLAGYDLDFLKQALQFRFEKVAGLSGSNSKGFRVYASQIFNDFGSEKCDIITMVDKGSKNANLPTIYLLVSKGNNNFASPKDDPELTQKMKDFLTYFCTEYLKEYERSLKINELTKQVGALEKDCNSLTSSLEKMRKELTNLENKIKANEEDLFKKQESLTKAKADLDVLK